MSKKKVKSFHKKRRNKKALSILADITNLITAIIKLVEVLSALLKALH
ncbi:hypothetical protein H702_07065 [Streptococcus equinus JB1]|uniref:Uncharacterized protein n=1 Tax=Streptococcus equinus JB1 TaxID=1294274 RepID=A0A091BP33_STREI|nr:hypothetical protein [Streptococcus equinus]KFN87416.1 hypothetical protein H702_07065 [Streptococcus equinus JB1]SFL16288.1 hypothetical protein SAMN02910290_00714 [Streptococcus equinus JB1]